MTWVAPWAFAGMVAVAAPILVHWLARQQSVRVRFPTLQFLTHTPPVSVRRHHIQEWPLLLVRIAIVALAVAALAQPVWVRPAAPAARPARAIVLDTSVSLQRTRADGRVGAAAAQEAADALAAEAGPRARILPAADLPAGIRRASAWLAQQPEPRELVVVSDLQVGALLAADLEVLPPGAGVRMVPIALDGPVPVAPGRQTRAVLRVSARVADARVLAAAQAAAMNLVAAQATAAMNLVAAQAGADAAPVVHLIFAAAPDAATRRAGARDIDSPAMFDRVAAIEAERRRLGFDTRGTEWRAIGSDLAVFMDIDPGSLESAGLMAAILRADPSEVALAEREPETIAPAVWGGWQREATPVAEPRPDAAASDGRWVWALVLVLLGVEGWLRRQPLDPGRVAHARVA